MTPLTVMVGPLLPLPPIAVKMPFPASEMLLQDRRAGAVVERQSGAVVHDDGPRQRARVVEERSQCTGTKREGLSGTEILDIGGRFEIEITGVGNDIAIGDFDADHS